MDCHSPPAKKNTEIVSQNRQIERCVLKKEELKGNNSSINFGWSSTTNQRQSFSMRSEKVTKPIMLYFGIPKINNGGGATYWIAWHTCRYLSFVKCQTYHAVKTNGMHRVALSLHTLITIQYLWRLVPILRQNLDVVLMLFRGRFTRKHQRS